MESVIIWNINISDEYVENKSEGGETRCLFTIMKKLF